jgi:hypothetical protein
MIKAEIEWNKQSDVMPENNSEVLIVCRGIVEHAFCSNNTQEGYKLPHYYNRDIEIKSWNPKKVTHWAYLPKPPKEISLV